MSAILSILNRDGQAVDRHTVETMLAASRDRAVDGQDVWFDGPVAIAHQHFWITPEEFGEKQPLVAAAGRQTIAADVRLDNRRQLLKSLASDRLADRCLSDAALILMAYRCWGTACVERLRGDFAFVIWDGDQQQLFAARDVLGARGLCYFVDDNRCLVGSEVVQLLAHPAVKSEINDAKIAAYLQGLWHNHEETFYKNIYYCPPAHGLVIRAESVRRWRYWDIDRQRRIRYKDDREYAAHYMELLTASVRYRLRTNGPVGISLSGGLDSTTLAAIASDLLPQEHRRQERLKSFSYVFDELQSCDERRYSQLVVDRYQLDATNIAGDDKWTLRDRQDWPVNRGYVFHDPYAWLVLGIMKAAQAAGCRLLLTGHFGDNLYQGGASWAAGMMADLRFWDLAQTIVQQRADINMRRDILINGAGHVVPQRLRLAYGRQRLRRKTVIHPGIHPRLAKRTHLQARIHNDQEQRVKFGSNQWHRYRTLTFNVDAQGASAWSSRYNRHGLELSMPYWDRGLIEYVMAIPADQLGRPQRSRWVMRNGASDLLPKAVLERRRKTSFQPLMMKGLLDREKNSVERIMSNPLIVRRQYVAGDWLEEQLRDGQGWSNCRQNFFLWKCLSLELWLSLLARPRMAESENL